MAIVRFSALKGAIHGLDPDGGFVHTSYDRRSRRGRTETCMEPALPAGGHGPRDTGAAQPEWRELDDRGFPRETADLTHLVKATVEPAVADLKDGPVVLMIHGFLFDPRDGTSPEPPDSDNPHSRIYHFLQRDKAEEVRHHTTGWPIRLGFSESDTTGRDGLAVAFGWHSRPGFARALISSFQNFYAAAYAQAEPAAWNLLTLLHAIDRLLPAGKKIDIFCHSLGSRVAIRLIALAAKHGRLDLLARIDRVLILGGSEYVVEARLMLRYLHQVGFERRIFFYNVVSRENDVLDKFAENFGPVTFGNSNVIGHNGLDVEDSSSLGPTWLDLQIDGRALMAWMREQRGLEITGDNPESVWDHWYYFTDPGNMALYKGILRQRGDWNIDDLRSAVPPIPDKVSLRRSIFGD